MQTERNKYWTIQEDVWITYFCWSTRITGKGTTSRTDGTAVLRRGRTCPKMLWEILWTGKQENWATVQSFKSLPKGWWVQAGGTRINVRIVRSLLTNCVEILVLGTIWNTWHSVVHQQTCKISHKMDSGMWQTIRKTDFLHSSHKRLLAILSCGKHGTAMQTGFVSRLRLCWRSWGLEINLRKCLVHFGKQNIRSSQLDVQETNFCFAQFDRIRSYFVGCCFSNGWVTCSRSLGHRDWSTTFNHQHCPTQTY